MITSPPAERAGSGAFPAAPATADRVWERSARAAPPLSLDGAGAVVVVAPHPDDETLAVGGLLADVAGRLPVTVLTVTDGEGSHPGRPGLVERRATEQRRAVAALGIDTTPRRLGLPDGRVARHHDDLAGHIAEACGADTVLLAPWENDGHTDHDACGRAAIEAARAAGARLLRYPLWTWQWARPRDLDALMWRRWDVGAEARAAKAAAIGCYPSQTADDDGPAIVPATLLERCHRPWEVLFDAG